MVKAFLRLSDSGLLPEKLKHGVVVIGNFDGVHRGHQAVLQQALDEAKNENRPALVLTFEPHPRTFFKAETPVDRLTPAAEKAEIFRLMGFDAVVEQNFDAAFCALTAHDFIEKILIQDFAASKVIAGYDFHFGKKRSGTPQFLQQEGQKSGFDVRLVEPFIDESGTAVSSSRVRGLLHEGKVEEAAALLGYRYTVTGEVIHGEKLGRTLGFPTANIQLPPETGLRFGIYAVRLRRDNGKLYDGVASFGRRPTVTEGGRPLLETYIFDFSENIYGETIAVSFFSFLRGEEKFDGLDALVVQMKKDEEEARAVLTHAKPLSLLDCYWAFDKVRP